jgi:hypothetical protein
MLALRLHFDRESCACAPKPKTDQMQSQHRADGRSIISPLCNCNLQVRRGFHGGASRGVDYGPLDLEDLEDAAGKPCVTTRHVQLVYSSGLCSPCTLARIAVLAKRPKKTIMR